MLRSFRLVATAACAWSSLAAGQDSIDILHFEELRLRPALEGSAKPTVTSRLSFDAFGRHFDISLEQNARLDAVARTLDLAPGVAAYRGVLEGSSAGWARIVTTPRGPTGLIWDGSVLYGVEHAGDSLIDNDSAVIFRLGDVLVAPDAMGCSVATAPTSGNHAFAALVEEMTPLRAQGGQQNLNIGAVADFEFHQSHGDDADQAMLTRLNNVDGIFSEQLGVQLSVAHIDVFTTDTDPFTSSDAETLLEEVAIYRGDTPAQDAQGLTHLFTGRDLDGATAGIAYLGVVCSTRSTFDPLGRSFGAGLSEGRRGAVLDSLVAAHEIGHNFGAPHDSEAGSACEATPTTYLMAPSVNGIDQFSACSIDQMQLEIESASCLTPVGDPDLRLTPVTRNLVAPAGANFTYGLSLANLGVDPATGVRIDVASAPSLEFVAATAPSGSCVVESTLVTCTLADLPGGASRQLTLTLQSATPGDYGIDAGASAAADANRANDAFADTVTIVPFVDLALSGNAAELLVEQSSSLDVLLRNESDFAANDVALTAQVSGGLRIDSASLDDMPCDIGTQTLTCQSSSLAGHSDARLRLIVTGVTAGSQQAVLTVSASESERDADDNSLTLAVQIRAVSSEVADSGGGGVLSPLWSLLGALVLLARRWPRVQ